MLAALLGPKVVQAAQDQLAKTLNSLSDRGDHGDTPSYKLVHNWALVWFGKSFCFRQFLTVKPKLH